MIKPRVLIFGGSGLVGSKFTELNKKNFQIKDPGILDVDILNKNGLEKVFEEFRPEVVINFAAFTNVEEAEKEKNQKQKLCYQINVTGAKNVAEACKKYKAFLIHISTEYVFNGRKKTPYTEDDIPDPVNWYGQTKYFGEQTVLVSNKDSCIARISMPFSAKYSLKKDIARFFLEQLKNNKEIYVIKDQNITPTLVDDIAKALRMIAKRKPIGIFHVCAKTITTPFKFAKALAAIFDLNPLLIKPVLLQEYNKKKAAKLLQESCLSSNKFNKEFGKNILHSITEELALFKGQLNTI